MGCACRIACVGPSPSIKKTTRLARGPKSKARATKARQRIDTRHASIDDGPKRQHDFGDKYSAASSDGFFSIASGSAPVPVGCQQCLHQSVDDRLPTIRQSIKNSPRIGQTIGASNNANATKCRWRGIFRLQHLAAMVRAQNKSSTRNLRGPRRGRRCPMAPCRKFCQPAEGMSFRDHRRDTRRANQLG
jgi:hypothetical protein